MANRLQFNIALLATLLSTGLAHADSFTLESTANSGDWVTEKVLDPFNPNTLNSSIHFSNTDSGTVLVIKNPDGNMAMSATDEIMSFVGAQGQGTSEAGTLHFHWEFEAGNSLSATAGFLSGGVLTTLASGELGSIASGSMELALDKDTMFAFDLYTEIYKGQGAQLTISDFHYTFPTKAASVPDSGSSVILLGLGLFGLGAAYQWQNKRRPVQS